MTAWEKIVQKSLVGSNLNSKQWSAIQAGLRDRIFFSSKVCEANLLHAMRNLSGEYAKGGTDLSKIRKQIRDYISGTGYTPAEGEEGTIKDLTSHARLNVIVKTNVMQARGFVQWADGQTPGAFAAFPCQEFCRVERRKQPRSDWPQRWRAAGGKFYNGRMIASKKSPIWVHINKTFGTPYPPFDWGSGMGVVDISRREAIELGVISDDEIKREVAKLRKDEETKALPSMNGKLQASVNASDDEERKLYETAFGDQVAIDQKSGTVNFQADLLRDNMFRDDFSLTIGTPDNGMMSLLRDDSKAADIVKAIEGKQLTITQEWREGRDTELKPEDVDILPSIWRSPHIVWTIGKGNVFAAGLQSVNGSWYIAKFLASANPRLISFYKAGGEA